MRDKLIELIDDNKACPFDDLACCECEYSDITPCFAGRMADALIAHGVTFAECLVDTNKTFADVPDNNVGDKKTMTNADRIRAMTNEQLRDFLDKFKVETYTVPFGEKFCATCPTTEGTVEGNLIPLRLHECDFADGVCPHGDVLAWWLSQPAEVEE